MYDLSVDVNAIDKSCNLNITKYSMGKTTCNNIIKKMFLVWSSIVNASNHTECICEWVHVGVSVKNIIYAKNIAFGILVHVFVKMENI